MGCACEEYRLCYTPRSTECDSLGWAERREELACWQAGALISAHSASGLSTFMCPICCLLK